VLREAPSSLILHPLEGKRLREAFPEASLKLRYFIPAGWVPDAPGQASELLVPLEARAAGQTAHCAAWAAAGCCESLGIEWGPAHSFEAHGEARAVLPWWVPADFWGEVKEQV
jgi:hypothetical protein